MSAVFESPSQVSWGTESLGEVCEVLDKLRKPITKKDRVAGPYPYYGATGVLDYVEGFIFDEPLVLIGEDGAKWGPGDRSAFAISGKAWVNNHAHVLRPDRSKVLDRWMISYLNFSDLSDFISGMTVPKLNQGKLREIPIPVPPLPEQERIVAILEEAFEGIATATAHAERNLHNARELFQSVLQSTFEQKGEDWVETTLTDILEVQPRNGWSPPAANHSETGTPVLTLSSVTGFQFRRDKIKHTSADTDPNRHYWVRNGDFLITRSNTPELVGHVAIAEGIEKPTIYPDLIMRMNPDPNRAETRFLYYQLRTPAMREEISGRATGANPTMKKINKSSVQTLPLSIAPLSQQKAIVQKLDALAAETRRLEAVYQRKLDALAELKQSLLQRAFAGKL